MRKKQITRGKKKRKIRDTRKQRYQIRICIYKYTSTERAELCASACILHTYIACVRSSDGRRLSHGINHVTGRARTRDRTVRQVEGARARGEIKKSMPPTDGSHAATTTPLPPTPPSPPPPPSPRCP